MGVGMLVFNAIDMEMNMLVGLIFNGSMETPDEISQPKPDQKPRGQAPPERLDSLDPENRQPQGNPHKSDDHRTQHMAQSAEERDKKRFGKSPSSSTSDHDKRQVMVWAK